jgi:hypothetical protein
MMSEESLCMVEIGIVGLALAVASHMLGIFRFELLGIVFFLATVAGQSVAAFLERCGRISRAPSSPTSR